MTCSASSFVGTRISPLVDLRSSFQRNKSVPTKCIGRAEAHPQLVLHSVSSEPTVCNKPPSSPTQYEPLRGYLCSPAQAELIWPGSKWGGRTPCRPKLVKSSRPASARKSQMLSQIPPETRRSLFEDRSGLRRGEGEWMRLKNRRWG